MPKNTSEKMDTDEATVLVVEDEREIVTLYEDWLQDTYTVHRATDGEQALTRIGAEIDVVLLDRQLPKLSGKDVLSAIRDRGLSCQVVIVSGVEPDFDLIRMEFDGYLVKPVSEEEIRTAVRQTLTQSSYDKKLQEFYTLCQKRSIIEDQKTESELETNKEYAELDARLKKVTEQLDTIAETVENTNNGSESNDSSNEGNTGDG
jgi:DNA-binding response OmpR family regulator